MEDKRERRERRSKVFEVRVCPDKWSSFPDEMEIQYTKNGFQTISFSLLPEEMEKFIIVFQDTLKRMKK